LRNPRPHRRELPASLPQPVYSRADQHHHHHRHQRWQNIPRPAAAEAPLIHAGQVNRAVRLPEFRQVRQLGRSHGLLELGGHFLLVQTQHAGILPHETLGENATRQLVVFVGLNRGQHAR